MLKNRKFLIAAGIVVGLIAFALLPRPTRTPSQEPKPIETRIAPAEKPALTAPKPASKTVQQLKDSGFRFQFSGCHGTPGSLVVKRGYSFLLDNRDAEAHTIAFVGQSYRIGPYGTAVAVVWKIGEHQITCDGGGAAKVIIES